MKKTQLIRSAVLSTIITASLAGNANAATHYTVSSSITNVQVWAGTTELIDNPYNNGPGSANLALGGTATDLDDNGSIDSTDLTLTGEILFSIATNNDTRLIWNLSGGEKVTGGTNFTSGTLSTQSNDGSGWTTFVSYDASYRNIAFYDQYGGHLGIGQVAGLNIDAPGTTALPGTWDGQIYGTGFDNLVSNFTFLAQPTGLWLGGSVELTQVPVPAAAGLFGSALLGLAGIKRRA